MDDKSNELWVLWKRVEKFVAYYDKRGPGMLGNGEAFRFYTDAKHILEK